MTCFVRYLAHSPFQISLFVTLHFLSFDFPLIHSFFFFSLLFFIFRRVPLSFFPASDRFSLARLLLASLLLLFCHALLGQQLICVPLLGTDYSTSTAKRNLNVQLLKF